MRKKAVNVTYVTVINDIQPLIFNAYKLKPVSRKPVSCCLLFVFCTGPVDNGNNSQHYERLANR